MVINKRESSGWSTDDWFDFNTACELLEQGKYKQLAELLYQFQVGIEQANGTALVDILAAAYQICSACGQCQTEVTWHENAVEETRQRQQALKNELNSILKSISDHIVQKIEGEKNPSQFAPSLSASDVNLSGFAEPVVVERFGVLQRFQHLLKLVRFPRLLQGLPPAATSVGGFGAPNGTTGELSDQPTLIIYCLGHFRVYQNEQLVEEWRNTKGKSVFKYLVTHRDRPVPKEVLMELFWPDVDPDAARNNLNVAIYGLRQVLRRTCPDFSHILFQEDCYLFNPELQIWTDIEEFINRFEMAQALDQRGQLVEAVRQYHAAEALYQGEYLAEDRYEDWLIPQRQNLQDTYLNLLDRLSSYYYDNEDYALCINLCDKILGVDPCREEIHRRLMYCYCRQRQPYLALRQYNLCLETLKTELDVSPTSATTALYEQIRQVQRV